LYWVLQMNAINFNELLLEQISQCSMSKKVTLLLGLGTLLIVLGYWLFIQANFIQLDILKAREIILKEEFEHKQSVASTLSAYRKQVQIMKDRFSDMLNQISVKNQMPDLLEEVSKTGLVSGLKFDLFAPQPEVIHDFYIELPIKITVLGTYFQLGQFLSRLAEMNHIVTLHEFRIESLLAKDNKMSSKKELVMNITVKIYRYHKP